MFFIIEATIQRGIPFSIAIRLLPYVIPEVMSMTLPITVLFAACLFYSKMTASNEIIAIKAMGIPPWRVMLPVWCAVFFISLIAVGMNDQSVSWGRRQMAKVIIEGTEETMLTKLRLDGKFSAPDNSFTIEVARVEDDGLLIDPYLSSRESIQGRAASARLLVDLKGEKPSVKLQLTNAYIDSEEAFVALPNDFIYEVPLDKILRDNYHGDPPMSKIKDELEKIEQNRQAFRRKLAANASFGLATGNYENFADRTWIDRCAHESNLDGERNRCLLAIPRRWASGFACFFFVWVGAPLAIRLNRSDYFSSFFICFIPILLVYYPLLMFGFQGVKSGTLHPYFAWTGNVVLGLMGIVLLKMIHRH